MIMIKKTVTIQGVKNGKTRSFSGKSLKKARISMEKHGYTCE